MNVSRHIHETTAQAGGVIIEQKPGDWVWWPASLLLVYVAFGPILAPSIVPKWVQDIFWALVSVKS